ncbi:MAG: cytochrome c oxidase subunit 3 family protein [Gammaproteobacteria bacterium]|jgi:nitric oxide reductase NorE protein|nr:cytochrome c oxidase subunit 3 family protein [Gammaproteobacteria bacterium]
MATVREDAEAARRLPGVEGVWVFIAADMCFFALLFVSFMLGRQEATPVFEASRQTLDINFGGINTLILLTSSWCVVLAVEAVKRDALARVPHLIAGAFLLGVAFMVSKALEYGGKIKAGISMLTNDFYMYYYTLTGLHLLHVLAGNILLIVLWKQARARRFSRGNCVVLECGASYWHMVDLLWIVLFPLLYLLR